MPISPSKVFLIVAADYSERLGNLPGDDPVWIADTAMNRPVFEQIQVKSGNAGRSITSFKVSGDGTPEDWLFSILSEVELHHGEHSQSPPYSVLQIVGLHSSETTKARLRDFGFSTFQDSAEGFVARKR
jgi:hypothetical protein